MSNRIAQANKAIRLKWEEEQQLVKEGKGTRDWTKEQQKDILERGKAYDENGKAFEGHHMKSVEEHPEYQCEPNNIQFLARNEHYLAHNKNFQNPTNGYYNYITGETKDFGDNKYEPCSVISLSDPIFSPNASSDYSNSSETESPSKRLEDGSPMSSTKSHTMPNQEPEQPPYPFDTMEKNDPSILSVLLGAVKKHPFKTMAALGACGVSIYGIYKLASKRSVSDNDTKAEESPFDILMDTLQSLSESDLSVSLDDSLTEESEPIDDYIIEEETVTGHKQRYGKDKHWVEKDPYPRPRKKRKNSGDEDIS